MLALAHDVPDVADHEEIAGHRSGQARNIVGAAGDEPGGEALGEMRGGVFGLDRIAYAAQEVVGQRDVAVTRQRNKTVGEIGIISGERSLDIVLNQAVVLPQNGVELQLGQSGRIVLGGENRAGLAGVRRDLCEHEAACGDAGQRCADSQPLHAKSPDFLDRLPS
jgi:hypothetical protein